MWCGHVRLGRRPWLLRNGTPSEREQEGGQEDGGGITGADGAGGGDAVIGSTCAGAEKIRGQAV